MLEHKVERGERNEGDSGAPPPVRTESAPAEALQGNGPSGRPPSVGLATKYPSSYLAALVAIGPAIPIFAAAVAVFVYAHSNPTGLGSALRDIPMLVAMLSFLRGNPVLAGTLTAVVISALAAFFYRFLFTAADRANTANFGELFQRLVQLRTRLSDPTDVQMAQPGAGFPASARAEAYAVLDVIDRELQKPGLQWDSGVGYLNVWMMLHTAEEALIEVECVADVISGALDDELRIAGSTMQDEAQLLGKLRQAIATLSPAAATYLAVAPKPPVGDGAEPHAPTATNGGGGLGMAATAARTGAQALNGSNSEAETIKLQEARAVLRSVRHVLNNFRDSRRSGLLRMRNRLIGTLALTTFVTFVLLALALEAHPRFDGEYPKDPIIGVTALFLVGALVGLFNRLYAESGTPTAVEDYGLSKARLLLIPIVSGLAAVGGVALKHMVTSAGSGALSLADIFRLDQNAVDLAVAAVFGLTPGLLVNRLRNLGDQYKTDLESTQAHNQGNDARSAPRATA
jgi:hypothetical protein